MRAFVRATSATVWLALALPVISEGETEAPLPPLEQVIQRAIERAQTQSDEEQRFKNCYFYTSMKVTEYRNGDGDLKKREAKQSVNDPDQRRARQAARKPAARVESGVYFVKGAQPSETTSNVRGRAFDRKDFLMNPDLLNRFDFVMRGREPLNGRDALVIDFKPKSGKLPERNLKEKFINRAAGRVWLDEAEAQLVKADLYLTQKVNVLGGLVGAVWKFTCTIDRERTDDGFWFTRASAWHLEGREVFIRRIVDYHEQTTDLRRTR
jgi:hypothetical protein